MYPAQFEYSKAGSVAEAIQILQGDPEAKIIAGGHSLIPLMKLRLARPSRVVDIGRHRWTARDQRQRWCCQHRCADDAP